MMFSFQLFEGAGPDKVWILDEVAAILKRVAFSELIIYPVHEVFLVHMLVKYIQDVTILILLNEIV